MTTTTQVNPSAILNGDSLPQGKSYFIATIYSVDVPRENKGKKYQKVVMTAGGVQFDTYFRDENKFLRVNKDNGRRIMVATTSDGRGFSGYQSERGSSISIWKEAELRLKDDEGGGGTEAGSTPPSEGKTRSQPPIRSDRPESLLELARHHRSCHNAAAEAYPELKPVELIPISTTLFIQTASRMRDYAPVAPPEVQIEAKHERIVTRQEAINSCWSILEDGDLDLLAEVQKEHGIDDLDLLWDAATGGKEPGGHQVEAVANFLVGIGVSPERGYQHYDDGEKRSIRAAVSNYPELLAALKKEVTRLEGANKAVPLEQQ